MSKLVRFINDEAGATAIEYAVIAAATGLVLIAVLPALQSALDDKYTTIAGAM